VIRLGQPVKVRTDPGLYAKWPLIDSVIVIDKRILDLEAPSQEVIASDQKRLVVDSFARYRVQDPLKFYQTVGSIEAANSRLSTLLIAALRRVLGEASFIQVVRDERPQLTQRMREQLDHEAAAFGIAVVDVRIRRADLPEQNSQAVYQRMQTERQREAAEFRAQGSQRSQEILSFPKTRFGGNRLPGATRVMILAHDSHRQGAVGGNSIAVQIAVGAPC